MIAAGLCLVGIGTPDAAAPPPRERLSISFRNVPGSVVLREIERQSGVKVEEPEPVAVKTVSVHLEDVTLETALRNTFRALGVRDLAVPYGGDSRKVVILESVRAATKPPESSRVETGSAVSWPRSLGCVAPARDVGEIPSSRPAGS